MFVVLTLYYAPFIDALGELENNLCIGLKEFHMQEAVSHEEHGCSGRCKVIVRRIMEQVRTETEQWSQMQEMLEQVREEMEELNSSWDFWEDQALDSEYLIQYLRSAVSLSKKHITPNCCSMLSSSECRY